jgi:uncharacterized damage-inducible protein DinB
MAPRIDRPASGEFDPYYGRYIDQVPDGDVLETLAAGGAEVAALVRSLPEETGGHRYAPEKWSVREVIGHLADAERIFAYRALRTLRGDATPMEGFDENAYVPAGAFDARTLADLADEYEAVRAATLHLFRSAPEDAVGRTGVANGSPVSARALAWIVAGHERHHLGLLRERYLS